MFNTLESVSDGYLEFESNEEAILLKLLIHDPYVIDIESQPVAIKNQDTKQKGNPYVPDVWAKFENGHQVIFDVKDQRFFDKLKEDPIKERNWLIQFDGA